MYKRKNVAVLVRTADFDRFRNTEQENFKTAWGCGQNPGHLC